MIWISRVLIVLACTNLVVSPAVAQTTWSQKERTQLAQYRDYLEPMGYRLHIDDAAKKANVYDTKTQKLAMEIPFTETAELRKFSPKNLNRLLMDEMVKIKATSKSSMSHTIKHLPTESAMFFMAMGAVVAGQLILDYSQNPLAMQQHIDHSMSPLGVFGFFAFMYSQGVTSNILAMYLKNPKFHHMIPYLGMTVGFTIQSYLSQILMDPNVKVCAKLMMGGTLTDKDRELGVDESACDKAYEYLVIKKKLWEFAPGLVAMLTSAVLAAVGQKAVTAAVLRMTGVDIALWLVPGSMQLKGFRALVVKGLQITAFVSLDMWLHRKVNYAWKNFFDGADFDTYNKNLVTKVNDLKAMQWSGSNTELMEELKNFKTRMMDWRMMNLSEVYEAHTHWSEALHQLTAMYNTSYSFYGTFTNEIRNSRFQESPVRPLERAYPFYGVTPKGLTEGKEDLFLTNPAFIEGLQEETVADVIPQLESDLRGKDAKYFRKKERQEIDSFLPKLKSADRLQVGQGLKELRAAHFRAQRYVGSSHSYKKYLHKYLYLMGNPSPILTKGLGYLENYLVAPTTLETTKGTSYYRRVGQFATPKITDYLTMQMICGPDVEQGQNVIKNSMGFPSVFLPPRISALQDEFQECSSVTQAQSFNHMASHPVKTASGKSHEGFISYLIAEARPSVIGPSTSSVFSDWWIAHTEKSMQNAFASYSQSYDEIVAKLIETTFQNSFSVWNTGPIANGTMNAVIQEQRIYLSLLEELFQSSPKYQVNFRTILKRAPHRDVLKNVESEFLKLKELISVIKVSEQDDKVVIKSSLENYQLEEQLQNIQLALSQVAEALGVGDGSSNPMNLSKNQRDLAVTLLENLQGVASEVMMYGSMANAVSWDKIRNLKKLNIEQNEFNNQIQEHLSKMRGLSAPGRF